MNTDHHSQSEGPTVDALVTTKRTLEREREGLLEQAALRLRAIAKVNEVIATLRGLAIADQDLAITPTTPARRRSAIAQDDLVSWTMEFALAQTRMFSTGDAARWMLQSGKIPEGCDVRGSLLKRIGETLQDDGRFEVHGTGPATRYTRRQTTTTNAA